MKTTLLQTLLKLFARITSYLEHDTVQYEGHSDFSILYPQINFLKLQAMLLHRIRNKNYFAQALVHRSYLSTIDKTQYASNERLEFLGDAVLGAVVADYLYGVYPNGSEGELTILRSRLVNRKALAYYAKEIGLWNFLLIHLNPMQPGDKGSDTILADAFEAIVAALYLDGGLEASRHFIQTQIDKALRNGFLEERANFKSALLELTQGRGAGIPRYSIIKEEGPDHDRTFTIQVIVQNIPCGIGVGKNKKEAEQAAAEKALLAMTQERQSEPIPDSPTLTTTLLL